MSLFGGLARAVERHWQTHDNGGEDEVFGVVPVGTYLLWDSRRGSLPSGWQVADGTNGTIDMRDRVGIGAGLTYAVGATGGAASATVSHDNNHASAAAMSHTNNHSGTSGSLTNNHGGHTHGPGGTIGVTAGADGIAWLNGASGTGADPAHGISITQPNAHADHAAHGHTGHSNHVVGTLPPYAALVWIVRIR
jgi:hypothetical protein